MGVVDDVRRVLQDVVTPDFRALEARVEALDKKIDANAKTLNEKIDANAKTLNDKIDANAKTLNEKIDQTATKTELALTRELLVAEMHSMRASFEMSVAKLAMSLEVEKRVSKLEYERAQEQVQKLDRTA